MCDLDKLVSERCPGLYIYTIAGLTAHAITKDGVRIEGSVVKVGMSNKHILDRVRDERKEMQTKWRTPCTPTDVRFMYGAEHIGFEKEQRHKEGIALSILDRKLSHDALTGMDGNPTTKKGRLKVSGGWTRWLGKNITRTCVGPSEFVFKPIVDTCDENNNNISKIYIDMKNNKAIGTLVFSVDDIDSK